MRAGSRTPDRKMTSAASADRTPGVKIERMLNFCFPPLIRAAPDAVPGPSSRPELYHAAGDIIPFSQLLEPFDHLSEEF